MGQHATLYNSSRWIKRRKRQLNENPLCALCLKQGLVTPANVADHIDPHRGDHDAFFHGELQSLCEIHHNAAKQSEELKGFSSAIGLDGWPIDSRHPSNNYNTTKD